MNEQNKLKVTEEQMHMAVMGWLMSERRFRDDVYHFANERACSFGYGLKLKKMGVRAGVSDIFFAKARGPYHGLWVELKTQTGRFTKPQLQFIANQMRNSYYACICRSFEDALHVFQMYETLTKWESLPVLDDRNPVARRENFKRIIIHDTPCETSTSCKCSNQDSN